MPKPIVDKGNSGDSRNWLSLLIKVGILIALTAALYYQVFHRHSMVEIKALITSLGQSGHWWLIFVVLLMVPLNWGLEAEKWRKLVGTVIPVSFRTGIKAVLGGVMLGLFTPNRVGEFGGRVLFLPKGSRLNAIPVSLVGSYAQILVTMAFGILAAFSIPAQAELKAVSPWIAVGIVAFLLLATIYYRGIPLLANWLVSKQASRYKPFLAGLGVLNAGQFTEALVYSILRYVIFTAQYLILLKLFGVRIELTEAVTALGLVFMVQSLLPTFALVELLRRGNIALYFFAWYTSDEIGVLAASSTLWLLNLVLPAVCGYILMLGKDLTGKIEF